MYGSKEGKTSTDDFEKTKKFLEEFCIGRKGAVAAVLKDTGKAVGYILFKSMGEDPAEDVYEIGWIFNRAYWRQGYAYEAVSALMDHLFRVREVHKVMAETEDAVRSLGLMKKLGLRQEGLFRKHCLVQGGRWLDLYWCGLLREDYLK